MRTIKINKDKPIYKQEALSIKSMTELEAVLVITLSKYTTISVGDKIHFNRRVFSENYEMLDTLPETIVKVVEVVENDPSGQTIFKTEIPEKKSLLAASAETVGTETRVAFQTNANIFAQDLYVCGGDIDFTITDNRANAAFTGLKISEEPSMYHNVDSGVTAADFLVKEGYFESYGCEHNSGFTKSPELYYEPRRQRLNELFGIYDGDLEIDDIINAIATPSQNIYYYKKADGSCTLWSELTQECFTKTTPFGLDYSDDEKRNVVEVSKEVGYWSISVGTIQDADWVHLDQETALNDTFVEDIKAKAIPDVIDMEKVKYAPIIENEDGYLEVSGITFNLYFRQREEENWSYSGDGWYQFDDYTAITETGLSGKSSDLLSDLNFVDTDAEYQKMKIKKSFIRLSFYNSNDPLTQSMLYYSTIFFDSGAIYGKYMKRRTELLDAGEEWDSEEEPKYVLESCASADSENRIDSQINISWEYNTERCSEGFNLYLFADDAPEENSEKTIYMKVEFNHAGYGRTIPMILWPMANGSPQALTIKNYRNALYIPLQISHIDDRYYYSFNISNNPCYKASINDGILTFNLFEPKLTD